MKSIRITNHGRLSMLAVALFVSFASHATGIGHVVVFGDSLSDNQNMLAQTGGVFPTAPIYFYGRQTNGLVWAETFAFDIGASLSNFAVVGAQTGTTNVWDNQLPGSPFGGLQNQIADYTSGTMDPGALHIVWAGANNFLSIPGDPAAAITEAVTDIVTAVATLKGTGNSHVRVLNMPDLGLTPRLIDAGLSTQGTFLTDQFNLALAGGLSAAGLGGVPIFDVAGLMREIVADPAGFGLTNVTDACIDPSNPTAPGTCLTDLTLNPDEFMFWDDVHPSRATHAIFSNEVRMWIPVPAAIWLFGTALGMLGWLRYFAAARVPN